LTLKEAQMLACVDKQHLSFFNLTFNSIFYMTPYNSFILNLKNFVWYYCIPLLFFGLAPNFDAAHAVLKLMTHFFKKFGFTSVVRLFRHMYGEDFQSNDTKKPACTKTREEIIELKGRVSAISKNIYEGDWDTISSDVSELIPRLCARRIRSVHSFFEHYLMDIINSSFKRDTLSQNDMYTYGDIKELLQFYFSFSYKFYVPKEEIATSFLSDAQRNKNFRVIRALHELGLVNMNRPTLQARRA
jgi:hypothetical protein